MLLERKSRDMLRVPADQGLSSRRFHLAGFASIAVLCLCLVSAAGVSARPQEIEASSTATFKTLANFDGSDGAGPSAGLVQGTDGNFYGTTFYGGTGANSSCSVIAGSAGCGTVFKATPEGKLTVLYSFCAKVDCTDGVSPVGLVQGIDGDLYGTTYNGGTGSASSCSVSDGNGGCGTVFKMTPAGQLTTLHNFGISNTDGQTPSPSAPLVQGTDGNFYGTTQFGGASAACGAGLGCGTVFKITPEGTLTVLHSFDFTDGVFPQSGLVQGTDGNFYGATPEGGASSDGTIFKITPGGTLTVLHSSCAQKNCVDGDEPVGLVQGTDGNFYGTTAGGGTTCTLFHGCGTVFKITPAGALTVLYSFCAQTNCPDGSDPLTGLVQGTDGNFYGTTSQGEDEGYGTIFKITPEGTLTTLHRFDGTDGELPNELIQATNGSFYGTTSEGGAFDGTIFSLSLGLGPFVETRPTSGKTGTAVEILGNNLTGATSVTFNGAAATFKVVSSSEIAATVPTSATTGKVEVKTPKGTLSSNIVFRVTPSIASFSPTDGPVGTSVEITGEALSGATSVTFDGVKSTNVMVVSDTRIIAKVPTGAKTGKIEVTTPGGTATSAENFTVN